MKFFTDNTWESVNEKIAKQLEKLKNNVATLKSEYKIYEIAFDKNFTLLPEKQIIFRDAPKFTDAQKLSDKIQFLNALQNAIPELKSASQFEQTVSDLRKRFPMAYETSFGTSNTEKIVNNIEKLLTMMQKRNEVSQLPDRILGMELSEHKPTSGIPQHH